MFRDRDFTLDKEQGRLDADAVQDLELNVLFQAMASGDRYLWDAAQCAFLSRPDNLEDINYRQAVLKDCLQYPQVMRELYDLTAETVKERRQYHLGIIGVYPTSILNTSVKLLQMLVGKLKGLKSIADRSGHLFASEGLASFFSMVQRELDHAYLRKVQHHLDALEFRHGVHLSAELAEGNVGSNYVLRRPKNQYGLLRRMLDGKPSFTFYVSPRDKEAGRVLSEIQDRSLNSVANAVAQAADHVINFFERLRPELAFYVGCLNLHDRISGVGHSVCFPEALPSDQWRHCARNLYDVGLALTMQKAVVANDLEADSKNLVLITGANQGGKSTFLRSVGTAQLMMEAGMFVPADAFTANISSGVFTHFRREEDRRMERGKLDEELSRMNHIVDHLRPNSLMLFNESFASTTEREGTEIARQIIPALLERHIKVFFVTHSYELARGFYEEKQDAYLFLRAERGSDRTRTFRILEGQPLRTSYGQDLYQEIFR